MVILLNPYGQRSNNLFQHVHLDSFCREHGIYFYNKYIERLSDDYNNLNGSNRIIDLCMTAKIPQIINRMGLAKYINFSDINIPELYKSFILSNNVVCCEGWFFRSPDTALKYRRLYQHLFKPNVDEQALHEAFLKKMPSEKNIGIHIRRGDYKYHENGRFYYSDDVYIDKIKEVVIECKKKGLDCRLLVFSNDTELDVLTYKSSLGDLIIPRNSLLIDQYLMSKCDYLIGPPSTFSGWASFIGDVPYYHIHDIKRSISLDDFNAMPYIPG